MENKYSNIRRGDSSLITIIRHIANNLRTWYRFHIKCPWVKYDGFVRVMPGTSFANGMDIRIGNNVQFGLNCDITTSTYFGNDILLAGNVSIVGRKDHTFDDPMKTIWDGKRGENEITVIEDDVWIGTQSVIMSGVTIGQGSIVAAGSVVTKSIPKCEIWGGNPAHKLKDRFNSEKEKEQHLQYLMMRYNSKHN